MGQYTETGNRLDVYGDSVDGKDSTSDRWGHNGYLRMMLQIIREK